MSAPFEDLTESDSPCRVAWLRFVDEDDGEGIQAALFETSVYGEPLAFCFTRIDRRDPSIQNQGIPRLNALSSVTRTLFRASAGSPVLVFGLADEMPQQMFTDALLAGLPFCRIRPTGADANGDPKRLLWVAEEPWDGSCAGRALDEMMERADPFEPFERAATALADAFSDERVQALAAIPRLTTVMSLSSLPAPHEYSTTPSHTDFEAIQIPTEKPGVSAKPTPNRQSKPEPSSHFSEQQQLGLGLAERLWAALAAPPEIEMPLYEQNIQLEWPGKLMPFQRAGVRMLLDRTRLLLADDMGLGKTIQAIAAVRILLAKGDIESCLVVAPASLLDQWRREIDKWAPELSAIIIRGSTSDRSWQWRADVDVTIVSYDTLRSDFGGNIQSPVRRKTWDIVVADEAQRVKNRNDTSDALKGLKRVRSWALTGTPIENHEEELASILEFVDYDEQAVPKRYRPGPELFDRHRELQLRRKKGDVLDDLPPKQTTKVAIDLGPKQRISYDKAEQEGIVYLRSLGAEVSTQHVFELLTRLKQICNADPETGESSKLDDIRDRLEQLSGQGHKALIFSQYTNETSGVAAAADRLGEFKPLTLTGDIPQQQRSEVIDRFKASTEHKALILSLRVGGLGLNLQEASYVFHLDRWWNPAVEIQAEDRSHRMGQTVKVNVVKYSCVDTIEERIDQILERKQDLFDQLIDDVSLDLSTQMNRQELFGLFGL